MSEKDKESAPVSAKARSRNDNLQIGGAADDVSKYSARSTASRRNAKQASINMKVLQAWKKIGEKKEDKENQEQEYSKP